MADVKFYPKGFVAMDNGDLVQVTSVKIDTSNNAKQIHTIRRKGAGITLGVEETTVSFDAVVDEEGVERNFFRRLQSGEIRQLRIKLPGETRTVDGVVKDESLELPLDDAVKYSIVFIGKQEQT